MSTAITWPKLLSLADYARACTQVTGTNISPQAISQRLTRGTLTATEQTIGPLTRRYIDTERYPPGPAPGRWPKRPAGSVPLPRRKPAAS